MVGSRVRAVNRILSSVLDFVVIPAAGTAAVVAIGTLMPSPAEASVSLEVIEACQKAADFKGCADVDTGVINWINADLVTHIVPRV